MWDASAERSCALMDKNQISVAVERSTAICATSAFALDCGRSENTSVSTGQGCLVGMAR